MIENPLPVVKQLSLAPAPAETKKSNWSSQSSAVFSMPAESKRELPKVADLNKILGIAAVTEVQPGLTIIHIAMSIRFNPAVDSNLYETILNQKLLVGLSCKLSKCSLFVEAAIPDDPQSYHQFMQNFDKALQEANKFAPAKGMG